MSAYHVHHLLVIFVQSALGCDCDSGTCNDTNNCGDVPCATYHDCDENCTCVDSTCESCSEFPNGECPEGCVDGPDGDCTGGPRDCTDVLTLEKIDEDCDLKATLTKDTTCSCPLITMHLDHYLSGGGIEDITRSESPVVTIPTNSSAVQLFRLVIRKGRATNILEAESLHDVSETQFSDIADNDLPISGSVRRTITYYVREELENGTIVTPEYVDSTDISTHNLAGRASTEHPFIALQGGSRIRNSSKLINGVVRDTFIVLTRTTDVLDLIETLSFENNCSYLQPQRLTEIVYDDTVDVFELASEMRDNPSLLREWSRYKVITSNDDRLPLFKWSKSSTGAFTEADIIRKQYIPEIAGEYVDILYGPDDIPLGKYPLETPEGELWSNRDYQVEVPECACDKFATLSDVVFCNPDELDFDLFDCNTKLFINTPFEPCDVNKKFK